MPTGRDLRERFDRVAEQVESDVPRHLHQTLRIGRRRILVRRTVGAFAVAAAIAVLVLAGPGTLRWIDGLRTNTPAGTSGSDAERDGWSSDRWLVHGHDRGCTGRDPPRGDGGFVDPETGTGRHRAALRPAVLHGLDHRDRVRPRGGSIPYERVRDGPVRQRWSGPLPMASFRSDSLTFTYSRDTCEARVALFTTKPWRTSG